MSTFLAVQKYGGKALLAIIVVTAAASFLWYRHVQKKEDPESAPPSAPMMASTAQMITRDFRHVETRLDKTIWVLEAAVAEIFEKKARLQRVKITYYGEEEEPVVITGRRGRVDLGNWDAVLFGAVRIVGRDDSVLKTRRLEWDNARQVLTAPWPVRVRSTHLDVRGVRMTANLEENWVRIEGRVHTVIRPPAGSFEPAT
jgi:LPS export ABC transporter protein LptC